MEICGGILHLLQKTQKKKIPTVNSYKRRRFLQNCEFGRLALAFDSLWPLHWPLGSSDSQPFISCMVVRGVCVCLCGWVRACVPSTLTPPPPPPSFFSLHAGGWPTCNPITHTPPHTKHHTTRNTTHHTHTTQ